MKITLILALLVLLSGCSSVRVTPASIGRVQGRERECARALKQWEEAVTIARLY